MLSFHIFQKNIDICDVCIIADYLRYITKRLWFICYEYIFRLVIIRNVTFRNFRWTFFFYSAINISFSCCIILPLESIVVCLHMTASCLCQHYVLSERPWNQVSRTTFRFEDFHPYHWLVRADFNHFCRIDRNLSNSS